MDLETVIINGSFYKKVLKFYYKFNSNDLSISFDKKEGYSIHRVFKNKSQEIPESGDSLLPLSYVYSFC